MDNLGLWLAYSSYFFGIIAAVASVSLLINKNKFKVFRTWTAALGTLLCIVFSLISWQMELPKTTTDNHSLYNSSGKVVARFLNDLPKLNGYPGIKFGEIYDVTQINPAEIITIYPEGNPIHMKLVGSSTVSIDTSMAVSTDGSGTTHVLTNIARDVSFDFIK